MKTLNVIGFVIGLFLLVSACIVTIDKVPGYDQFDNQQLILFWCTVSFAVIGGIGYMIPLLTSKPDADAKDITA